MDGYLPWFAPPPGRIRLVIDSDAKNEIDDQFAIAWALRSPERFRVEAVYAVPFSHEIYRRNLGDTSFRGKEPPRRGMEMSYQEILKLFSLLGEDPDGRVFRGSPYYLRAPAEPVISPAAEDLVRRGMEGEGTLWVAAIGAATNIASALLMEPRLRERIGVVWLGGQPPYFPHGREFNLGQDILAAQYLFDCGVPLVWVPCMTVASQLVLSENDVRCQLLNKGPLSNYLGQAVLSLFSGLDRALDRAAYHRRFLLAGRDDMDEAYLDEFSSAHVAWSRPIWDVSTIAFLKNPNWVQSIRQPAPVLRPDCFWASPPPGRHALRVATYCQRDLIIGDMLACLAGS